AAPSTKSAAPPELLPVHVPAAKNEADGMASPFDPPSNTLVVLPFANVGDDASQNYFSDGITEELTNALGQNTGLRVIAWDTASRYRDGKQSATSIGKVLNVASVLTGKILRQGDQVRVIVELVNTSNGYQMWSHHYDDSLRNIFAMQDRITEAIAGALKVKFATTNVARAVNPEAHDLVLKARALMLTVGTAAPLEQARSLLEQAIALDPNYAAAHAKLARAIFDLTQFSTLPLREALPQVRAEAHKSLALEPNNVDAIIALANADLSEGNDASARTGYERALKIDPSNATAHLDYALTLPPRQSLAETLKAVQLDPENIVAQNNLAADYIDAGEYQKGLPAAQVLMRLAPDSVSAAFGLALTYALLDRDKEAVHAFDLAQPSTELDKQLLAAGKLAYRVALDENLRPQALAVADALRQRSGLDPSSLGTVIEIYMVLDQRDTALEMLPEACALAPPGCTDLSINPLYRTLRGEPRFEALVKRYDASAQ
ncbi:MAG TPA: hypothetical protein VJ722_05535, partial [Rhodanobacteraceae bacterium]|nr:hypothetical protein [Rhodanobacteraceae bacterium]